LYNSSCNTSLSFNIEIYEFRFKVKDSFFSAQALNFSFIF
jgi:hypothetical protein